MICTFGDVTDVIWWRELALPVRAIIQPNGALRPVTWGERGLGIRPMPARAQQAYDQLAGLSAVEGARAHRRAAARERRSARRAAADHARGQVLREGRSPARDRHQPAVVHQDDGVPRASCWRAAASCSGIRRTCRRASRTGSTASPATGASAASASSACRSRSGTRCAPTASIDYDGAARCRTKRGCRSIRRPTCRTAIAADQRDQPGGFTGDPDIMDTWATSSLTPQIVGRLGGGSGSVRARVPDGRASAGARHHPHLAVLDGAALAARARHRCRGSTRRSPAGSSIPIARRCRSRRATSSRRWRCSRSTARTACATGRRAAGRAPTRRSIPGR